MNGLPIEAVILAGMAVFGSGGAAWIGTAVRLNGTRERVERIEQRQNQMEGKLDELLRSTSRVEALQEVFLNHRGEEH